MHVMKIIDMQKLYFLLGLYIALFSSHVYGGGKANISFPSKDGIEITADTYFIHESENTPLIVLFHQAGWSRGEYLEIAPKLNKLGFNCLAIDQRAGGPVNGIDNETSINAKQAQKNTRYIDTLPDLEASLLYVKTHYPESKIIAWGSSYSAALALQIAGTQPELVDGVLAFAPGEYFFKQGKPETWIKDSAANINVPVFITSARNEKRNWSSIYSAIKSKQKASFVPSSKGNHGSKALWDQFDDSNEYWNAVNDFLEDNFL